MAGVAGVLFKRSFSSIDLVRARPFLLRLNLRMMPRIFLATTSAPASEKPIKMPGLSHQYLEIKKRHPDFIVLFQVGDFYEIYSQDAIKVAEKTSLRVSRNPNVSRLMAGFPVRSLDSWLMTLVQQGFQLAICPQMPEKTAKSSRLIHRDVIRLVTPGTLLEPLHPDANYLLSIIRGPGTSLGMAWLDLPTGDFYLCTSTIEDLEEDLSRINPAEILMAEEDLKEAKSKPNYKIGESPKKSPLSCVKDFHLTVVPAGWFTVEAESNQETLQEQALFFNSAQFSSIEISAGSALLKFVNYTQKDMAPLLNLPKRFTQQSHMAIDSNTRRSLELTKPLMNISQKATLFGVMNNTSTSAGRRLLYSRLCAPSTEICVIQERLDAVEFFYSNRHIAEEIHRELKQCPDIERKLQKVATGMAGLSDLRLIRNSILLYAEIRNLLLSNLVGDELDAITGLLVYECEGLEALRYELDQAVGQLTSEYSVMEGYSHTADEIRVKIGDNEQLVRDLRDEYRSLVNIPKLVINSHKAFIRVVEISNALQCKLADREDFVRVDSTNDKVRYSTLRLQELNADLKALQQNQEQVQKALSEELCQLVTSHAEQIKHLAKSLAELDVTSSLALLALNRGYTKPCMVEGKEFFVSGGRHPVVDILQPDSFVCNDCDLGEKNVWIVTGPNMGGKSTFLRQNALIAILAQAGSYIPAQKATIGVVDRLFARIGASDNLVQHQSTFMSEMLETSYILSHATENSLVVIDELGRGTSMLDGLSIAWAVMEYLHNVRRCRTLASTHYHQLSRLAECLPRVDCYHVTAQHARQGITFTFKVMPGADHRSFGIDVARLAGIPETVEARAREILTPLEDKTDLFASHMEDRTRDVDLSTEITSERIETATVLQNTVGNLNDNTDRNDVVKADFVECEKDSKYSAMDERDHELHAAAEDGQGNSLEASAVSKQRKEKKNVLKAVKRSTALEKGLEKNSLSCNVRHRRVEFVRSSVTSGIVVILPHSLTPRQSLSVISEGITDLHAQSECP